MEIALILGPFYGVIGLSILLYAKPWQKLMEKWSKDHLLLYPVSMILVLLGLIIVNLYNVWEWNVWLLVTITGWIMLVKGVLYLLLPGKVITWALKTRKALWMIYVGGAIWLVVGAVLSYFSYSYYFL